MATVKTPRLQATVIVAMDVSNSMGAKDVKPSRIGAAKLAARDFVRDQPSSVKIGVVAFGPSALIVQTPTFDHASVLRAINDLSLGGGTSLATGILTSLDAIAGKTLKVNEKALNAGQLEGDQHRLLRGSDHRADLRRREHESDQPGDDGPAGVDGGRAHPDDRRRHGRRHAREIGGFSVATALDPQTLENVAKVTNGTYHQVADRAAISEVSKTINLHFTVVSRYIQISAIFAAAAVLLLVVGALLSVLWFGRVM